MQSQVEVKDSFRLLMLASAVTLILWFIPFGDWITYPIRLFVTFIHESGHALAALATLGGVNRVALDWSGSGVTETVGGAGFLISSAGYLSTTIYGSALLLLVRRLKHLRAVAVGTGVLFLVMTVLFGGNLLAWLAGVIFGVGTILLGLKVKPKLAQFLLSFLAVQCVLNAFYDLRTLLYLSAFDASRPTDAQNMSIATGGFIPAMVWALLWSLISLVILAATMVIYYKSLRQQSIVAEDVHIPLFIEDRPRSAADRSI